MQAVSSVEQFLAFFPAEVDSMSCVTGLNGGAFGKIPLCGLRVQLAVSSELGENQHGQQLLRREPTTVVDCPNAKKEKADDREEIRQEDDTKEKNGPEKSPFQADDGKEKAKKHKSSFQTVSH